MSARDRRQAEMVEDRRGEVDRGDQPALVRRLRAQLAAAAARSSPAAATHSSSCAGRVARRAARRSASPPGGRRVAERAQIVDSPARRPAGRLRPGASSRLSAAMRASSVGGAPSETAATRPLRSAAATRVEVVGSRRCPRRRRRPGPVRPAGRDAAAGARLRRACAPPASPRPPAPAPAVQATACGGCALGVGGGGDARALGDVEQQLLGRVGALRGGHDPRRDRPADARELRPRSRRQEREQRRGACGSGGRRCARRTRR